MTSDAPAVDVDERETRILILAPVGRDARLAEQALARVPLRSRICRDLEALRREIAEGAGVVLLTEEALASEADGEGWLAPEEPWSQLPLVVLTREGASSRPKIAALRRLEQRRNVSFLQRPVPRLTLVSTVRAALESRRRQYVVRNLLEELEAGVRQRDEFLATLGHELRNPLAAIANAVELLRDELPDRNETARFASDILERQTGHLGRILDDLLEISRITSGKLELRREPLDLCRVIRGVVEAARRQLEERTHHLELTLPDGPVWVEADPTRVEQILWNLLSNACKYTDPGGRVAVSLRVVGADAEVQVADDGRGMAPDFLGHAFDLFAQAEMGGGGLGLGLPLSRRLAEMHEGALTASSAGLDKGSEFLLRIPLREGFPGAPSADAPQAQVASRRVLIVEDHADLAWGVASLLQRLGHEVRCVGTGGDALALAPDYRPEVVLLDIGLPDMDGAEVAKRLRETLGAAPLVAAMSGFGQESVRRRSLESGCDRHLTKPVAVADLRQLLASAR